MPQVEIDNNSGFCFGVTTAIKKAEEELAKGGILYCLGDIVHNSQEMERLKNMGLVTIDHEAFAHLRNTKVLLRAHGEPPSTYETARRNHIQIIDATCPVVLNLQKRIRQEYDSAKDTTHGKKQIVIYGKKGHAEVLGLVGQTEGNAIIVQSEQEAERLDYNKDIYLYSQTTKSLEGFNAITQHIQANMRGEATLRPHDTICRQVANRMPEISRFAQCHDLVYFVSDKKSSNGKMLHDECLKVNPNTHFIENENEVNETDLKKAKSIGICGATSTPKWLMEKVRTHIEMLTKE